MIRFLTIIIFLSLIYLSALMIGKYDATLSVGAFDYIINVSLFLILFLTIFLISIFSLGLRIITWFISLPFRIIGKVVGFKKDNQIYNLLEAYANLIMDNRAEALKKLSKITDLPSEYKQYEHFIRALCSTQSERDSYLTFERVKNQEFHHYAAKKIMLHLYNKELYDQALKFAKNAELGKSKDAEIIYILMILYAELEDWDKFIEQVSKLKSPYKEEYKKISELYLKGAKFYLERGKEKKTIELLHQALEYNPTSMGAIEIFCTLNNSQGLNFKNLPILESAFSINPSFELFELYYQSSSSSPQEIYSKFEGLVDNAKYRDVMLSIAAYLKLYDKVDSLLSCKI